MNDKTIKDKQRKSLDPTRHAGLSRPETLQWKPGMEGHRRNLTISENFIRQKLGKSSSRNQIVQAVPPPNQPESQNTRKSNQKNETDIRNPGIKSYLSEKCIKFRPSESGELRPLADHASKDRLPQTLVGGHFLNANYKIEVPKAEGSRGGQRSQWTRSNLSIQKKDSSVNPPKQSKNNSFILSVLAKNKQTCKLKNLLLDEAPQQFVETRNKALQTKLRPAEGLALPVGLNLPNSPIKNKTLLLDQHTLNNLMGKGRSPDERETKEKNLRKDVGWEANSPTSIIQAIQKSAKNGELKDLCRREQNYFFNLKSLQKIRIHDKTPAISQKSALPSALNNNQSVNEARKDAEAAKLSQADFCRRQILDLSSKKHRERRNHSSKIHPDIVEQFPELFTERIQPEIQSREQLVPKFQQILQNICIEKETEDLRALKEAIRSEKIPETDISFYDIIKRIGEGSFGKVYLGLQKLTNRLVAIKRLDKANCKDEATRKKILSEVNIQKTMFGHPNIVKLLEVFENKQHVFFVMEYAANGDLLKHLKNLKRLEEDDARAIFFQVASGLRYIHHNGIIHRDIKLDNVLIDEHFHYKICDFGVGRYMKPHELINEQCGTPAYLAPEIVLEKGYKGFGADVWSLGVLLFCLLTGNMPFKAATLDKLNELIVKGEFDFPGDVELSQEVRELVGGMLSVDPDRRMTIEEVLEHPWVKAVNMNRTTFQNISRFEREHFKIFSDAEYKVSESALSFIADLGFPKETVRANILQKQMNHATACYFTIERDFI